MHATSSEASGNILLMISLNYWNRGLGFRDVSDVSHRGLGMRAGCWGSMGSFPKTGPF